MRYTGFWRRAAAYTIDIVPIVLLTAVVFYLFLGFDETWQAYRADSKDVEARIEFLVERNQIRDLSFCLWLIYSARQ